MDDEELDELEQSTDRASSWVAMVNKINKTLINVPEYSTIESVAEKFVFGFVQNPNYDIQARVYT